MPSYSVITDRCKKDPTHKCITVCQRKAIGPKKDDPAYATVPQMYINPKKCLSCGDCIAVCESKAIFAIEELPEEFKKFAAINAEFFKKKKN
ncbi:MAG TPA: 4Fe-4S dicluster domain-containing protein [candidate division Zixibacteria bacterium]|nr:4Fe-4S dicluster domain-containing protein [Candidatus Acidoferrales bacterium]HVP64922.1 4Fe-4S dicluster domain-containing protein [candidate division Zixibacteria bacterium]